MGHRNRPTLADRTASAPLRRLPRAVGDRTSVGAKSAASAADLDRSAIWRQLCRQEPALEPERPWQSHPKADRQRSNFPKEDTGALFRDALAVASEYCEPGACVYATVPGGPLLARFISALEAAGFGFRSTLVWVKNHFVLGMSDYHFRHELILYGWLKNGSHLSTAIARKTPSSKSTGLT